MKFEVPYFKQTTNLNCGPTALKMIFAFFNDNLDIDLIQNSCGIIEGKGVSTIRLVIGSSKLGFKTEFYSKSLFLNEANLNLEFYKNAGDLNNAEESKRLVEEAIKNSAYLEEKTLELKDILNKINSDSMAVVLLDWNVVVNNKDKGYGGHFVPIVGYDEENVYVHNQGLKNPTANLAIPLDVFDEARKTDGTDEDIIFITKK